MKRVVHNNAKAALSNGAAFALVAVFLSSVLSFLALASCATKEQVVKVEERVARLELERSQTQTEIHRLDSLASSVSKNKTGEYARLANLIQSLSDRIDELSNSVADLQDRLNFIQSRQGNAGGSDVTQTDGNSAGNAPGVDCTQLYDDSFILVRKGEYESARAGFQDFLQYCKNSDLADNAQYWIAESYYSRQKYTEAATEFTKLTTQYANSEKRPTALYKLGRCAEETGNPAQAQQYYSAVVNGYPSTSEAQLAKDKLAELAGEARNRGGK